MLLYGSPGTGKTSFIHALAGELALNIYVINLSSKNLTDDSLADLISLAPAQCLLLIEDIDAAFVQRESKDGSSQVTFSGLLNSVDGVSAQEGRLLCLTTNHLERLDEALIRPGRVDVRAHFGKATQSQVKELFIRFYPHQSAASDTSEDPVHQMGETEPLDQSSLNVSAESVDSLLSPQINVTGVTDKETEELAEQFAKAVPDGEYSIAQLQGFLMGYKKAPGLAVEHVGEFVRLAGSSEVNGTAKIAFDDPVETE